MSAEVDSVFLLSIIIYHQRVRHVCTAWQCLCANNSFRRVKVCACFGREKKNLKGRETLFFMVTMRIDLFLFSRLQHDGGVCTAHFLGLHLYSIHLFANFLWFLSLPFSSRSFTSLIFKQRRLLFFFASYDKNIFREWNEYINFGI